jgi:hypothetical protein
MSMSAHEKALEYLVENLNVETFYENDGLYKLTSAKTLLKKLPEEKREKYSRGLEPDSLVLQHYEKFTQKWLTHWKLTHAPMECE